MNPSTALEGLFGYFDNLAEGITILDLEGGIVSMNRTTARILGVPEGTRPQGRIEDLSDAFTPAGDRIPSSHRPVVLARHGRFVRNFEAVLRPRGGLSSSWVEISTAPILDEQGNTAQIILSYRDVTDRRRTDETRARLAAIVESCEDAIIGLDNHAIVTTWNRGAEKVLGYSAAEIVGASITRLIPPDREGEEDIILARIRHGEVVHHFETVRRRKDGVLIDVSLTISPVRGASGEIIGASKIARDITGSKCAQDALHESQQRLTGIIDSAMDAILTIDEQQRIVLFNAAAEKMFLCPQSAAIGQPVDRFIPERYRAFHGNHIGNFSKTGVTARAMGELGTLWALRSDGDEFPIEASISQAESGGGKLFTVILRDITDRRLAEESLREQAGLLKASQMIARDMQSRIVFWPEGAEKMYGYTADEALGALSHQLFQTQFPEPIENIEAQLHATGRWEGELIHRKRDGDTIVVSTAWILHYDREGRPVRILESLVDVTERRHAEESLRRQAEELARSRQSLEEKSLMLESVLDSMTEGLVAADEQGKFILWNPAAEKIVGLGPGEIVSSEWNRHYGVFREDGVTPLPPEENPLSLAIAGESNSAVIFVRNEKVPDGRYMDIYASPLRDRNGAASGGVTAFRDITERRRAEEQVRQSEERFARIFRSSPIAVTIATAAEGRYLNVNAAFLEMLGYPASEVIGRTDTELGLWVRPEQRAAAMEKLARDGRLRSFEAQYRTCSGQKRTLILSMDLIALDGAECTITNGLDVTETRTLEQQFRQSQKMEALGQLTGGIAHDFNNLLGVIVGNLDLLERIVAGNESALKRVTTAQRTALRGADLTRRLLAFSRREQLNPAPIQVEAALRDLAELAGRTLGPEIRIATQCDADLPPVFADAAALESALLNLAVNARDAMPHGGAITLSARLAHLSGSDALIESGELGPGQYARIAVSDSGQGMSRETLDRALEPFFTTKPRDKGTGLGLAMVYGFVKQSGGAIRLYSEVGVGTTVSLFLPLSAQSVEEISLPAPVLAAENPGGTVLVVDDELDLLDIAEAFLAELGYTVIRAADGASALRALEDAGPIDLMVTDIIMPGGINGFELAERVRRLRPGIRILYTSGFPAEALAERSGKLEDGPILNKPYQRAEFADMVRKSLQRTVPAPVPSPS